MATELKDRKQVQDRLTLRSEGGKLRYQGGIPLLTEKMGMRLCPLFLDEVGRDAFLEKIRARDWQEQDTELVALFLMRHNVQPSSENCFRLVMGARIELMLTGN